MHLGQLERVELERRRVREQHVALRPRTGLDLDAESGEHNAVEVAGPRVRRLLIEAPTPLVELPELLGILGERPHRLRDAIPRRVDVDLHQHGQRVLSERLADCRRLDRTPTERNHGGPFTFEHPHGLARLEHPEARLAFVPKEVGDRAPHGLLDLLVEVEELPADQVGHAGAERRLAGAHEADEGDVAV